MKAAKSSLGAALDRPDRALRFYLFHGPDPSGSRALADRLVIGLGQAEKLVVAAAALKADPAILIDEAGAIALFGGVRAVWIEPAGDDIAVAVAGLLDANAVESPVIAIAGSLRKGSALLKLAEGHSAALAHASYPPEGREADQLMVELGRREGLRLAPNVAERVAASSANDQAVAARELTKFAIYLEASPQAPRDLDLATLDAVGADAPDSEALRLGDHALGGDLELLASELERLGSAGGDAIPVLRALQRRLLALAPMRARIERGERVDAVMASAGRALFWKDKPLIQRFLSSWTAPRLAHIAERAAALELQLMTAGVPAEAALGEELVAIARALRR